MLSRGVEISIARGIPETNNCLTTLTSFFLFFLFLNLAYLLFLCGQTHNSAHPMVFGTMDFQLSKGQVVHNLKLLSFPLAQS